MPAYPPFPLSTLRNLWRLYPDENIHRLILEVIRMRVTIREIEQLRVELDKECAPRSPAATSLFSRLREKLGREPAARADQQEY
jgi:hypothetical protein